MLTGTIECVGVGATRHKAAMFVETQMTQGLGAVYILHSVRDACGIVTLGKWQHEARYPLAKADPRPNYAMIQDNVTGQ